MQTTDLYVTRVDDSGATERTGFFALNGSLLAGSTHVPRGEASAAGLVICPSLFTEALRNYRRETLLGRALAAHGVAVQRFHYRGSGNSDEVDVSFATMVQDAEAAADELRRSTGLSSLTFFGTRFGALVAAAAARSSPGAPLVLVEPVMDAGKFFAEGLRAKVMSGFKTNAGPPTTADLLDEVVTAGSIDVLGDPLTRTLYESSKERTLTEELGDEPRPVLVLQIGAGNVRRDFDTLVSGWRNAGFTDVDVAQAGTREAWWFLDDRPAVGQGATRSHGLPASDELIAVVTSWLSARVPGGSARP